MKKIIFTAILVSLFHSSLWAASYAVDPAGSSVEWVGSKVTGKHNGKIMVKSGSIEFENRRFTGGEAVIDMSSITVDDIENSNANAKLTGHLKNDDFFSVDQFPTATLVVTNAKHTGYGNYNVTADFTIRGVTVPQTFKAVVRQRGNTISARATITLDRTHFNVKYGSGKFFENLGDRLIHDQFTLTVNIQAKN